MIQLNEQQLFSIEKILEEQGLNDGPLKEELLDHLCCQVEQAMDGGMLFHQALQQSLDTFQEDEMKELQQHFSNNSNQKRSIMMKVSLFALSVLLLVAINFNRNEILDQEPVEGPELVAPIISHVLLADPPTISPLRGDVKITSGFGMRLHPVHKVKKQHKGIDFKAAMGTPVYATSGGIVKKVGNMPKGYGKHIIIEHDDHFKTLYAQLSQMDVKVGDEVKRGDQIGAVGSSGLSTAPHLHYEVIKDGVRVDPEEYLRP
ncbi:MAG: M23 family metallopeptidase [Bacteroidota bacterium]